MIRPAPPLSQLHYFAPESEEERKIRQEMGFTTDQDDKHVRETETDLAGDGDGDVDMGNAAEIISEVVDSIVPRETPKMPEMGRLTSLHMGGEAKSAVLVGRAKEVTATMHAANPEIVITGASVSASVAEKEEVTAVSAEDWMSVGRGKGKEVVLEMTTESHEQDIVMLSRDEDDEEVLELDSGSSDFGEEDDDEDEDEI
jgi:hypothetical protein